MNIVLSDFWWGIKHYSPLSIALIVLTVVARIHHNDLHKILEINDSPLLLLAGFVIVGIFNICRMNKFVLESKLLESRKDKIRFVIMVVPTFALDFFAELMALWIFFLSLFYFAYDKENQYLEFLFTFHDYVYSLAIIPVIGYNSRVSKRKTFGDLKIEPKSLFCVKVSELMTKNWLVLSLTLLITLNLFLIKFDP